nr:DUF6580 family putative transport protein [Neorhodopirellula pilleata]
MNKLSQSIIRAIRSFDTSHAVMLMAAVAVAVIARLLPHPPNFTPLAALGLFAGTVSRKPAMAAVAVVAAMLVSDAVIGFHSLMPLVYGCLLVNIAIGALWVRGSRSTDLTAGFATTGRIVSGTLMGSVLFFLVTNLGCFVAFYPTTLAGLIACYTAAIPFFQYTLAGDLVYTGALFGLFAAVALPRTRRVSLPRELSMAPAQN